MDIQTHPVNNTNKTKILFSNKSVKYNFLSNFYIADLVIDEQKYYHVEGYYQSQKFNGINNKLEQHIKYIYAPSQAKKIANNNKLTNERNEEWNNDLKCKIMTRAILIKFLSHKDLSIKLIETGNDELVNNDSTDNYWGNGKDGKGNNTLGKILMGVRNILKGINVDMNSEDTETDDD